VGIRGSGLGRKERVRGRKDRFQVAGVSFRPSTFDSSTALQGSGSGEVIERHVAAGWGSGFEQGFDAAHGFGCEQDVAANIADLCGNVVDHHHLTPGLTVWTTVRGS